LDHSVAQPNNCEVNVKNNLDYSVAQPNNCKENVINLNDNDNNCEAEVINLDYYDGNLNDGESIQQMYESLLSNRFEYIPAIEYNEIFPGYNQELFTELKNYLTNQNSNDPINRHIGTCTFEDLSSLCTRSMVKRSNNATIFSTSKKQLC